MRDFAKAVDNLDLVYAVDAGRETTVYAEDLVVDDAGKGEVVEHVGKVVPDGWIAIFATAFGVEAIRLRDSTRFVVAADQMHALWIA